MSNGGDDRSHPPGIVVRHSQPSQFCNPAGEHLQAFPDLKLSPADYEQAAEFFNLCRSQGVQGSNTDFCCVLLRSTTTWPF